MFTLFSNEINTLTDAFKQVNSIRLILQLFKLKISSSRTLES